MINMIENILEILRKEISEILEEQERLEQEVDNKLEPLSKLKEKLNMVISDSENFKLLDLDSLSSSYVIDSITLKKAKFYKLLCDSDESLNLSQIEFINNLLKSIIEKIDNEIESIRDQRVQILGLNGDSENIESLMEKLKMLEISGYLDNKDLALLETILKKHLDIKDVINAIIFVSTKSLKNIGVFLSQEQVINNEYEEIQVIEESNLDLESVINLFKDYNYDFTMFSKRAQDKIIKYGNINVIKEILSLLQDFKIYISNYSSKSDKIANVLCFSNANIVKKVIGFIIEDMKKNGLTSDSLLNEYFDNYLKQETIFVKKRICSKKPGNGGDSIGSSIINGAFDNYLKNREFFLNLGVVDINVAMKKCSSFFASYPETNVKKKNIFDFYGISQEIYANTLSSFGAPTPMETLDRFIELGYFEYVKNNFSRVYRDYNSSMFYKMKKASQEGINYSDLVVRNTALNGNVTNENAEFHGVLGFNGPIVTEQYSFESEREDLAVFDKVVGNSENSGPLVLCHNNFFIKKLDKFIDPMDEYVYNFDGVRISRIKLLRLYETLMNNKIAGTTESVVYCACKYSILTKEEFDKVEACISGLFKEYNRGGR